MAKRTIRRKKHNTKFNKNSNRENQTRVINNKRVSDRVDFNALKVEKSISSLTKQKLMKPKGGGDSDMQDLQCLLSSYGCSISHEPIDFSFFDIETDTEQIENENILPNFSDFKNEKLIATKSFKNVHDPFYNLDDRPPRKIQQRNTKLIDTQTMNTKKANDIAAVLVDFNMGNISSAVNDKESNKKDQYESREQSTLRIPVFR